MTLRVIAVSLLAMSLGAASAQDSYVTEVQQWQKEQEKELRADGGWLTVAGPRHPLETIPLFVEGYGRDKMYGKILKREEEEQTRMNRETKKGK